MIQARGITRKYKTSLIYKNTLAYLYGASVMHLKSFKAFAANLEDMLDALQLKFETFSVKIFQTRQS